MRLKNVKMCCCELRWGWWVPRAWDMVLPPPWGMSLWVSRSLGLEHQRCIGVGVQGFLHQSAHLAPGSWWENTQPMGKMPGSNSLHPSLATLGMEAGSGHKAAPCMGWRECPWEWAANPTYARAQ